MGLIVGKALFERISLKCYLNQSIWRQISGFTVFLQEKGVLANFGEDSVKIDVQLGISDMTTDINTYGVDQPCQMRYLNFVSSILKK